MILVMQALFLTFFFIFSNILPPIYILAIPITFQTIIIYLLPYVFNLKQAIFWYLTLLVMVLIGIPMMSGFRSGLSVLIGPSAGFIYGWLIIIVVFRICLKYISNKYLQKSLMVLSIMLGLSLGGIVLGFYNELTIYQNVSIVIMSFIPIELIKFFIVSRLVLKIPSKYLS